MRQDIGAWCYCELAPLPLLVPTPRPVTQHSATMSIRPYHEHQTMLTMYLMSKDDGKRHDQLPSPGTGNLNPHIMGLCAGLCHRPTVLQYSTAMPPTHMP